LPHGSPLQHACDIPEGYKIEIIFVLLIFLAELRGSGQCNLYLNEMKTRKSKKNTNAMAFFFYSAEIFFFLKTTFSWVLKYLWFYFSAVIFTYILINSQRSKCPFSCHMVHIYRICYFLSYFFARDWRVGQGEGNVMFKGTGLNQ
jgi:hypothetical protein